MRYALLALAVAFNAGAYALFKFISAEPHGRARANLLPVEDGAQCVDVVQAATQRVPRLNQIEEWRS